MLLSLTSKLLKKKLETSLKATSSAKILSKMLLAISLQSATLMMVSSDLESLERQTGPWKK